MLKNHDVTLTNYEDTKVLANVLGYMETGLKAMSREVFGVEQQTFEEVLAGRKHEDVAPEEWAPYAGADADLTLRLYHVLMGELNES